MEFEVDSEASLREWRKSLRVSDWNETAKITRILSETLKMLKMARQESFIDIAEAIDKKYEAQETVKVDENAMEALKIGPVFGQES